MSALLPRDKTMRSIAEKQLFCENGNVGRALAAMFDENSISDTWQAKHNNFLPLVQFARSQANTCELRAEDADTAELDCGISMFELILNYLRKFEEQTDNAERSDYYKQEVQRGECYLKEMKGSVRSFKTQYIYDLLIRNWSGLSDMQITYRLLHSLVQLNTGWRADPEARLELLDLMKKISAEW